MVPGVGGQGAFDPDKPWGLGQQAPLTPEYQKVLEDSMADQAKGGLGNYPTAWCLPGGMPRMMTFGTQEYVITPETTYILIGGSDQFRRSSPTDASGPMTSSRPIKGIRSANGSTATATGPTTYSKWKRQARQNALAKT